MAGMCDPVWRPVEKCTPGLAYFERLRRAMVIQLSPGYGGDVRSCVATGRKMHAGACLLRPSPACNSNPNPPVYGGGVRSCVTTGRKMHAGACLLRSPPACNGNPTLHQIWRASRRGNWKQRTCRYRLPYRRQNLSIHND